MMGNITAEPVYKFGRRANPRLAAVVREVRALLRGGEKVFRIGRRFQSIYRNGNVQKYCDEILDIRVSKSGLLLQVKLPGHVKWSSVWSSEVLRLSSGDLLYESPDFEELEKQLSLSFDDLMDEFLDEFGVIPWKSAG